MIKGDNSHALLEEVKYIFYAVVIWSDMLGGVQSWSYPYPAVDPFTLIKHLEGGGRLEKPSNAACSDKTYDIKQPCAQYIASIA